MNLPDLEAFIAVAESGSIVAASARLNLTQPAVSRRIQNLESSLGTELLDRNSKPPRPTAAGRTAYEFARRVLGLTADLRHAVGPGDGPSGEFRVGVTNSLGHAVLVKSVGRLRSAYPRLRLHAVTAWSSILIREVQSAALDAVVVIMSDNISPPEELQSERLGFEPVAIVAGRSFPVKSMATLAELSSQPWVLDREGCNLRSMVREALNTARLPFVTAVEATGMDLQLALVAQGMGLGLVTRRILAKNRFQREVRTIAVKGFKPRAAVWLVAQPGTHRLASPTETLRETVAEILRGE